MRSWARPLFMTLLIAPLLVPASAWTRGNGGHSGRGHGSHHREEGPAYAVLEMTELKMVVFHLSS